MRGTRGRSYWTADLVAWELVDTSAITVVQPAMFAVGRGFGVPREREGLAMGNVRIEAGWIHARSSRFNARAKARKP